MHNLPSASLAVAVLAVAAVAPSSGSSATSALQDGDFGLLLQGDVVDADGSVWRVQAMTLCARLPEASAWACRTAELDRQPKAARQAVAKAEEAVGDAACPPIACLIVQPALSLDLKVSAGPCPSGRMVTTTPGTRMEADAHPKYVDAMFDLSAPRETETGLGLDYRLVAPDAHHLGQAAFGAAFVVDVESAQAEDAGVPDAVREDLSVRLFHIVPAPDEAHGLLALLRSATDGTTPC
jgi:hypothetical protein